jgi:hypothetical protein
MGRALCLASAGERSVTAGGGGPASSRFAVREGLRPGACFHVVEVAAPSFVPLRVDLHTEDVFLFRLVVVVAWPVVALLPEGH